MEDDNINIDISSLITSTVNIDVGAIGDVGTIWIDSSSNDIYINDGTQWNTIDVLPGKDWEDVFPDFNRVQEMCKDYPALEKAYENFKTVYKMVEQDWIGKQKSDQQSLF